MIGAVFSVVLFMAQGASDAAPAAAAPAAAPAVPAPTTQKVNRDGQVCHTEEILGSRIPKKVCMTPAEAEARSHEDQQNLQRMQSQFGYNKD